MVRAVRVSRQLTMGAQRPAAVCRRSSRGVKRHFGESRWVWGRVSVAGAAGAGAASTVAFTSDPTLGYSRLHLGALSRWPLR